MHCNHTKSSSRQSYYSWFETPIFIGKDFYWKSTLIVGLLMELQRLRANPSRQRGLRLVAKIPLKDSKTRLRRGRYDHHRCNHR